LPGTALPGQILPGPNPATWYPPPPPVATISTPLQPPPQQFTNAATLLQANICGAFLFITFARAGGAHLPGQGFPGATLPGFGNAPPSGVLLVNGVDYVRDGSQITMTAPPPPGSVITAVVFAKGLQLGGSTPYRFIAPWVFAVAGAYDGVTTAGYQIQVGPTIAGVTDGVNSLFSIGVSCSRLSIYRNGILQTNGVQVANGQTGIVFLAGYLPQPGDLITCLGYPGW
jgi:hypothetical protein